MKKQYQATGKRKTAIAQVFLMTKAKEDSVVTIYSKNNKTGKTPENFFPDPTLLKKIYSPFFITKTENLYDIKIKLIGGGYSSQIDASCHGISRALAEISQENRNLLKNAKLLTRDSRVKERKKYGLKKARKAPQFSKR